MRTRRLSLLLLAALASGPAAAKSWKGIDPGVTTRDELMLSFGRPSRVVDEAGYQLLAYFEKEAIAGTTQVQFRVNPRSRTVDRIDVFPDAAIDWDNVAGTYGPECRTVAIAEKAKVACHFQRELKGGRAYFDYPTLGLQVIFNDQDLVEVMVFTRPKKK